MPHFVHDGFSLHYEIHGRGRPVVMLHGLTVTFQGNFARTGWLDSLTTAGLQVIGLDFRGHGGSAKSANPGDYGTKKLAGDVVSLVEVLGLEKPSLVGYSLGSVVALHLLHANSDQWERGALVGTGDGLIGFSPFTIAQVFPQLQEALSRVEFPTDLSSHVAAYWTFATNVSGDRPSALAAAEAEYPPCTAAEAGSVQVPVLIVSGEADPVLGGGQRLAAAIPAAEYLEISGADHFSLARDVRTRTAVTNFLTQSSLFNSTV